LAAAIAATEPSSSTHRHLQHQALGVVGGFEDGQRQPDLGVEVLGVGVDAARQQRPGDVLDRGLADRAGDADDLGAEGAAVRVGQAPQRRERVGDGEDPGGVAGPGRFAGRRVARAEPVFAGLGRGGAGGVLGRRHDAPGARLDRGAGELAAVAVGAGQAEEEVAGTGLPGGDRRPRRRGLVPLFFRPGYPT
jgi:hypothetical protein